MDGKSAKQIIDEIPLTKGKQINFAMIYDTGFEFIDGLLRDGEASAVRVYLHLVKNMDRNSGAIVTDLSSIISDLGISQATLYRALTTLKKSGHVVSRHRNLFEINPEGAWKGHSNRKNSALFMTAGKKTIDRNVKYRLNAASKHQEVMSVAATFEPVEGKKPNQGTLTSDTETALAGEKK
ncbi:replication/maintenance protein RepL [Budviciaceae bacterium CWB-B4]|uniref:Replication/maintenance protein RepL n=1 Tax=Limnobaculum xujianqingii TaxID=2738837 RepID=A0A9D7FRI8_9GAMM|nr:replication/maintenance protein RepL [Limnobaculum xujianqingii]MBK5072208.1 replication/maintenance protein RepL [Limnobaculum xujianqingii]MBK5175517.1 replication/maintenance protein RepL [Limnobaculum xujianqingii]